jgi:hypothetical protein
MRDADGTIPALRRRAMLETRLIGVRRDASGQCALCPPEQLLLLPDGDKIAPAYAPFAARADQCMTEMLAWVQDGPSQEMVAEQRGRLLAALPGRLDRLKRSCEQEYIRWLDARRSMDERTKAGDTKAAIELAEVNKRLRGFTQWRDTIVQGVQREPELVEPGEIELLAVALILPAESEAARREADARVEALAMTVARAAEEEEGATVYDVSTPAGARMHGFPDYPGFDLFSIRPDGEQRYIEVKGRAGAGDILVSENEWSAAGNHLDNYWLYVVFGCDGQYPSLHRVQCPASVLPVRYQGVRITAKSIRQAAIR